MLQLQDLLRYCERVETSLRLENQRLTDELNNYRLDLADATKSRRELQQQVEETKQHVKFLSQEQVGAMKFRIRAAATEAFRIAIPTFWY